MVLSATNYVDVAEKISFFLNIPGEVFRRNHVPKLKEKEETRLKMKKSKKKPGLQSILDQRTTKQ